MPKFVFSIQDRRGDSSRGYFTKYSSKIWVKETYKSHERWWSGGGRHADYIMIGIGACALFYLHVHGIISINLSSIYTFVYN